MPKLLSSDVINSAVPERLLESYLPFFTPIRKVISESTGIDITNIVSALVLTLLVASAISYGYSSAYRFLRRWFSSSITIRKDDKLYEVILSWIAQNATSNRTRSLMARSRKSTEHDENVGYNDGKQFNFKNWDASKPPVYTPAYGTHHFWFGGSLFHFDREKARLDLSQLHNEPQDTIHIRCWGFSSAPIKKLIQECKRQSAIQQRTMTTIRSPHYSGRPFWAEATTRPSRPMETVYLAEKDKETLIQDVEEFLHPATVTFYAHRGIPYRRGYLFYGPPGTGKTSLSLALAGLYGLELYVLSLVEHTMTDQRLSSLFSTLPQRCIVLLEDIDTAGLASRKDEDDASMAKKADEKKAGTANDEDMLLALKKRGQPATDKGVVTLSGLLNAIDGVASHEGRILIMTTNDPESLDKALIRPGRVDQQIYFGHLTKANARGIFKRMYVNEYIKITATSLSPTGANSTAITSDRKSEGLLSGTVQTNERAEERISQMADVFAANIPETTFTPAEVQGFLVKRRRDPQAAIDEVEQWAENLLAAKAAGKNVFKGLDQSLKGDGDATPASKESGEWVEKTTVDDHSEVKA